jgi:hypothetical protein
LSLVLDLVLDFLMGFGCVLMDVGGVLMDVGGVLMGIGCVLMGFGCVLMGFEWGFDGVLVCFDKVFVVFLWRRCRSSVLLLMSGSVVFGVDGVCGCVAWVRFR